MAIGSDEAISEEPAAVEDHMANFRPLPFSILSLLLLASLIMAAGSGGDGSGGEDQLADCVSLAPCRGGISNDQCCKEIEKEIDNNKCNCVCQKLIQYKAPALATNCVNCAKCKLCKCGSNRPPLRGTVG